jgi:hypothetical protein
MRWKRPQPSTVRSGSWGKHPDLAPAALVLNESGFGITDGRGKLLMNTLQVAEKSFQNFAVETTKPGGHSAIPLRDNAIYDLSDALVKVRDLVFPIRLIEVTKIFFSEAGR